MSGPHGIAAATSSFVTNWDAPANPAVPGISALTFHPPPNHRNSSWARSTQASRSWPQHTGSWPILREWDFVLAASQPLTRSTSGSTAIRWSASAAKVRTDCSPETATPIGIGLVGMSQSLAESTRKCSPL